MSTAPIPMPQQNPGAEQEYIRTLLAQQGNTQGMTQMAPQTGGAVAPVEKPPSPGGPQQVSAFGVGEKGAHQRESMQNLVKSAQTLASTMTQAVQAKQQRAFQVTLTRYQSTVQGLNQAQAQQQQAVEALKKNPQDPQAQAQLKSAQAAIQTNTTNLNDMANDPKAHKVISKAYGVDDKNAQSPERAALVQMLQKQNQGMSPQAAGLVSQMPQTQQLSPQAQGQAQMQQAGVVGKPATQGQVLAGIGKVIDGEMKRGIATDKLVPQLAKAGLVIATDEEGNPQKNEDGSTKIVPMTPEQRALIPGLRAQDDYKAALTDLAKARTAAMTDAHNPMNQARMINAQAHALSAQAAMLHAQKYQPGSATSGGMDNLVDMFHIGQLDPSQIPGFGKSRTEFFAALHKKYPDDNPAQASEDYKFASNVGTQMTLKGLDNLVGPDGKSGNLQEVVKSSNGINRTSFPAINDVEAWAKINKGDPKMAAYYAQVLEVSDQIAKILQGGSTGAGTSDAKLKQAQAILNSGFSKDQIKGIANGLAPLLANRKSSIIGGNRYLKNQYQGGDSGTKTGDNDIDSLPDAN